MMLLQTEATALRHVRHVDDCVPPERRVTVEQDTNLGEQSFSVLCRQGDHKAAGSHEVKHCRLGEPVSPRYVQPLDSAER